MVVNPVLQMTGGRSTKEFFHRPSIVYTGVQVGLITLHGVRNFSSVLGDSVKLT